MDNINNTNDMEQNLSQTSENQQPKGQQLEEKDPEQELQEVYREQQQFEQQEKQSQAMFTNLKNKQRQMRKKHSKLKRSKHWAHLLCIVMLGIIVAESTHVFFIQKEQNAARVAEIEQEYSTDYWQWKTSEFKNYYGSQCDSQMEERRNAADRLSESNRDEMNAYIASLDRVVKGLQTEAYGPVTCFTDTQTYDLSGYTIADSGNTVIFPGAVLRGDSLFQGTAEYTLLSLERTPMHLTSNQVGGNSAEIENVSYRGTMEFLDRCAEKNEGQAAKEWNYYMQICRSSAELKASLGVELPNFGGFEFGSTNNTETSSVAVIYRQIYYTVDAEPRRSATDYFQNDADMEALGDYEPAYISSVDYGRMLVVLIEGNMSSEELGAKVNACIKGVSLSAGLANIRMDSEITSQLFQYGGEQKDAGMITDTSEKTLGIVNKWNEFWNGSDDKDTVETRINDFIRTDAPATNPMPIGYTLKYLSDNSYVPAMMVTGQRTMLADRDAVRQVKITTDIWVDWDESEITDMPIYTTETSAKYEYEFLWDSERLGILQGQVLLQENTVLGSYWNQEEVSLDFSDCLPYGARDVTMGYFNYAPVTADITISNF